MLLLLACTGAPDTPDPTSACPAPAAPTELAAGFVGGTEGVAFSGGSLYVSVSDGVVDIWPDGAVTRIADVPHALGLAPASGGLLVADPGEFTFDGTGDDGALRRIGPDGAVETLATGMPNPNFVVAAPWGDLLVSDDTGDVIYAVDAQGGVSTWLEGVPSPNGMAWSASGDALYVVSTMVPEPPLWAVPVADGRPGTPTELLRFDTGAAPDGLALDAAGGVWVALNLAEELVRVDVATGEVTDEIEGVTTPASLAFGAGAEWDACALYVTELLGERVWEVPTAYAGGAVPEAP